LPGLLSAAAAWWPQAGGELRLFEVGHIFHPLRDEQHKGEPKGDPHAGVYTENGVREWPSLAGLVAFAEATAPSTLDRRLLEVKGELEAVLDSLVSTDLSSVAHERAYFHPGASGNVMAGDRVVAKFGRVHPRLSRAFDLPEWSYAFAVYLESLAQYPPVRQYRAVAKFPATKRDIAVVVGDEVSAGDLMAAVRESGAPFLENVRAFDEYRGRQIGKGRKSIALAIVLRKPEATITDEEANASTGSIVAVLVKRFGASLRE
jgi:phenylalanyl-tRNA synthetase beta chain